ncbi:putative bifunctional diguanylate cyclase/phosphodiesterase [Orrella dioscoreae]|uniref:Diguanylate cyclase/phosphodiesterase (GGDEF & EAL domains) with PAS/PAC sensor(S) n=1 Tax=Orrella dioscoreae TaxID=1851544 RepID=A0A1C3K4I4_9BURK|nr:sensor domain-containing phosphodiesterase [Orrella dioscoreae]SBT26392.1 diguanylate cyclase/phosphodiesterase (GGDEF & EAL domains) with PAS/PAC sensor(s) [Orrella dioscoreae]SOE46596.1 diguanylate cyclase/phosphodiesterase (GGDEF & EAL domains) with PAS/PAC sensor(s) [Orrella dioscoreae]
MKCPSPLPNESERLHALSEYGLDPQHSLPSLDPVVRIASRMFNMPVSAINMIGSDHVFFAASVGVGVGVTDMRRDVSFCAHAITQGDVMVVPDARLDDRFHDNPLVSGEANIRFYAGVPLHSPEGHPLGALCIIDTEPHGDFGEEDKDRLRELARMAGDRLELRRVEVCAEHAREEAQARAQQERANAALAAAAAQQADSDMARKRENDDLRKLSSFDPLTGLANRGIFYRRVEEVLSHPSSAAILMVDLDGFKDINDTMGHAVGDVILRELAARLARTVGLCDTVARLGGDEFAILQPNVMDLKQATELAQAVLARVAEPISVQGQELRLTASCGVALAPLHAHEALELVGNADLALVKAKAVGRGRIFVFVPNLRLEAVARRLYGMELHRAVANGEFLLFYQPQIKLASGELTGAEALLRWRHPQLGLLAPGVFLPSLEGGPLAATVGSWVLDEACSQAAFWRRSGAHDFRIGVNLFGVQFRVGDLATEVMETLARHGLPPEALELEITENIVLNNDDTALEILRRLRAHGVGISFDDFGTGYASLSLLKTHPLTRIKIDRSFVSGILESKRDATVIRAILDVAHSFDLCTIAEGIETDAQRERLLAEHCEEGQGYLFGRPLPAQQFAQTFGLEAALRISA